MNLNYSKQKGLYVSTSELVELSIVSHDEKGFLHKLAKQSITIPGNGICVKVDTNFGYGIRSYHRANVSIDNKDVLNLDDKEQLNLLSDSSFCFFSVTPGNWEDLFLRIIHICDNIYYLYSDEEVNAFFDELDYNIKKEKDLGSKLDDTVFLKRKCKKMVSVIKAVERSIYCNDVRIRDRLINACKLLINQICQTFAIVREKSNLCDEIFDALFFIHEYLHKWNKSFVFFEAMRD